MRPISARKSARPVAVILFLAGKERVRNLRMQVAGVGARRLGVELVALDQDDVRTGAREVIRDRTAQQSAADHEYVRLDVAKRLHDAPAGR